MKISVQHKLESLDERYEEVQALLSDAQTIADQDKYRALTKEYSQLEDVVKCFRDYQSAQVDFASAQEMMQEDDAEMREMAQEEYKSSKKQIEQLESDLQILLLPKDPNDESNCFIEIRAGAGGDEAAIFAGDLFRMYSRYAETQGWKVEVVTTNHGDHGGYKVVIANIIGAGSYGVMKF
jgi:peptide chain release factor 1